jgi:uncharacterized circularly permuted ATP-grasp superfamily protein
MNEIYDEAYTQAGELRPHARAAVEAVLEAGPARLEASVNELLVRNGVGFRSVQGDARFHVDPVPRVITADDWVTVKRGLAQRVRALNAFVADAYGERRIVAEGVVPAYVIDTAEYYEPQLRGIEPPSGSWIGIAGLDVVRGGGGEWLVLEDNLRTPSGFAYIHAARIAVHEHLDVPPTALPRPLDGEIDLLADALRAATPPRAGGHHAPRAVVLTDGPDNSAYWEHGWLARTLGIPLVETRDIEVRKGRLHHAGDRYPIDVVYRRTDSDRASDPLGQLLLEPIRNGTLGLINQYGTGVADDKLAHAYADAMIRFYLGEEPVIRGVPTFDLAQPDQLEQALDRFDQLVLKPRAGHGGVGVLIAPHARREDVAAVRRQVEERPGDWIAQQLVMLSTHPTVSDGTLAPRHVDLRPFVFMGEGGSPRVLPGGLTRVARDEGALVVNSSQNGGAKDTWILPERDVIHS